MDAGVNQFMVCPRSTESVGKIGAEARFVESCTSTNETEGATRGLTYHIAPGVAERRARSASGAPRKVSVPAIVWVNPDCKVRVAGVGDVFVRLLNMFVPLIDCDAPVSVTVPPLWSKIAPVLVKLPPRLRSVGAMKVPEVSVRFPSTE
jgi:hypothetical protein